jgi:TonB family protein
MDELSSPAAVIEITNAVRWGLKLPPRMRKGLISLVVSLLSICALHAQPATPLRQPPPPRAIYTPKPVYRPEWAKQGLTGKGIVLVTIDQQTGNVTGARMLQSTGNKLLDGAALEAYSQWRFQPGTGSRVKIPIEFANRPRSATAKQTKLPLALLYPLLILVGFGVAVIAMRGRRRT